MVVRIFLIQSDKVMRCLVSNAAVSLQSEYGYQYKSVIY